MMHRIATPLGIALVALSLAGPALAEHSAAHRVVKSTAALGDRALWEAESPALPIYANTKCDLLQWTKGQKALPETPRLNCWEVVFAGAVEAGVLSGTRVRSMYAEAARAGKQAFLCQVPEPQRKAICNIALSEGTNAALSAMDDATYAKAVRGHQKYKNTLLRQLGPRRPLREAVEGDLVVFSTPGDPVCHVALATGQRTRGGDPRVLSFEYHGMIPTTVQEVQLRYANTFGRCGVSVVKPLWDRLERGE